MKRSAVPIRANRQYIGATSPERPLLSGFASWLDEGFGASVGWAKKPRHAVASFCNGKGGGVRSTVKIFDLNPNLGFNAPADSSRISSDAKVVSVSPRQDYLTLRVFLTCSSITTSSNQDQQDGRSKQPEKAAKAPCRATMQRVLVAWFRVALCLSFSTLLFRWEVGCVNSFVKDSGTVPGSPEQAGGGSGHEDSGSL